MDTTHRFMIVLNIALLIVVLIILSVLKPSETVVALLIGAATMLLTNFRTAWDFIFGSSAGSKAKDAARDLAISSSINSALPLIPIAGAVEQTAAAPVASAPPRPAK